MFNKQSNYRDFNCIETHVMWSFDSRGYDTLTIASYTFLISLYERPAVKAMDISIIVFFFLFPRGEIVDVGFNVVDVYAQWKLQTHGV